jgi:hypothetical protein
MPDYVADGWIGPELVSTRGYDGLSLVVDSSGVAHAAAVLGDDVYYLTNLSGTWTRERLTSSERTRRGITTYGQPSLAIDSDGALGLAYVELGGHPLDDWGPHPEAIYITSNSSGAWSAPAVLATSSEAGPAHNPSLQLGDGRFHMSYQVGYGIDVLDESERYPVRYVTDAGGALTDVQVAEHGTSPTLRLAEDGSVHLVFGDVYDLLPDETELRYATAPGVGAPFTVETVTGSSDEFAYFDLGFDAAGRPTVAWWTDDDGELESAVHAQVRADGWSSSKLDLRRAGLPESPRVLAMTTDASGAIHLIANVTETFVVDDEFVFEPRGVFYVTNRGGDVRSVRLPAEAAAVGALRLGADERAHLLFGTPREWELPPELWYGVGPGD